MLVRMASWMPCVWRACTPTLFGRSRVHALSLCSGATGPETAPVDYPRHGTRARLCYRTSHNCAIPSSYPGSLSRRGPRLPGTCEAMQVWSASARSCRPYAAPRAASPRPSGTSRARNPHHSALLQTGGGSHALCACGRPLPGSATISRTCSSPQPCVSVLPTAPSSWSRRRT